MIRARYSPDDNPAERISAVLKAFLANTAFTDSDHLIRTLHSGFRKIQHRS